MLRMFKRVHWNLTGAFEAFQEVIRTLGGLDHLYLNHALQPRGELPMWPDATNDDVDSLLENFEQTMNINTNSYVFLYTAAFPHLLKSRDARVAVVSSLVGQFLKVTQRLR